jgi:hypothetical protein
MSIRFLTPIVPYRLVIKLHLYLSICVIIHQCPLHSKQSFHNQRSNFLCIHQSISKVGVVLMKLRKRFPAESHIHQLSKKLFHKWKAFADKYAYK